MSPLVALVAGSYIVALERRQTGDVEEQKASNDHFLGICREIQSYISQDIMQNNGARQRFLEHCGLIVTHSHVH